MESINSQPVHSKLLLIQTELKAPKNQFNSFGKYKYRNLEDILEALKPLLKQHGCTIVISDDVTVALDRVYVKATITLIDIESGTSISATGLARESLQKKGMDESQITGTASSYARKYGTNGLFAIDDTKDADTDEFQGHNNAQNGQGNGYNQPQQNNGYNQPQNYNRGGYNQPQQQNRQNVPNQQHYGNQNQNNYQR